MPPTLEGVAARVALISRGLWRVGRPVQLVETPRSWVLLADSLAYKMGKPVPGTGLDDCTDGGFLATQRRHCEDEVRLNRRLEGAGQQKVVQIRGPAESPSFSGSGPLLGYAVAMDRVSPASLGSLRLARGTLEPEHVVRLAGFVDRLHRSASTASPGVALGRPEAVLAGMQAALASLVTVAPPETCRRLERWLRLQATLLADRIGSRLVSGHIREGHGDLRLEHVVVDGDEARVFTGVDHDPGRRWIDVQGDVAGMVVDLMVHGRRDLAFVFLNRYLELSGDYAGLDVLRFHLVLLTLRRAADQPQGTPASMSGGRVGPGEHLALALRLAYGADPRLLITHGLPGTGKSYAAGLLLERAGAIRICLAAELRRLSGQPSLPHFADAAPPSPPDAGQPMQAQAQAQARGGSAIQMLIFDRLRKVAALSLGAGFPTIVDAACLYRWQRDGLREVAGTLGVPFTILDCQRGQGGDSAADDADHEPRPGAGTGAGPAAEGGEPLGELERPCTLALANGQPLSPAMLAAQWLRAPAQRPGLRT